MNNDEYNFDSEKMSFHDNDCYPDRNAVSRIDDKEGEVFLIDNSNFGIRYKENPKPLLPCNLPEALQAEGKKIIFSGIVKETKLEELWAGEPFVITKAEERS